MPGPTGEQLQPERRGGRDRHPELPVDPDTPRPLHLRWSAVLLVGLGGTVGTLARYGVSRWLPTRTGEWPWGTLLVNVVGAFLLGLLLEALARRGPDVGRRQVLRLTLGTGFCGGFTTYSTLALEADQLIRVDALMRSLLYLGGSLLLGVLSATAGILVAARHHRSRTREVTV